MRSSTGSAWIWSETIVVDGADLVTSMSAALPETVTVSSSVATPSSRSARTSPPITRITARLAVPKPVSSATTSYGPGCSATAR